MILCEPTPVVAVDRVVLGDCVAGLRGLEAGSVDLAFADPPFNIGYKYDVYDDRQAADAYLDWTRAWTREVARVLKPTGLVLAGHRRRVRGRAEVDRPPRGRACRCGAGWSGTTPSGSTASRSSRGATPTCSTSCSDPRRFTFNPDAIRVPSARQLIYGDKRANAGGRLPDDTWILRPQEVADGFGPLDDTWHSPRVCGTFQRAGRLARLPDARAGPGPDHPRQLGPRRPRAGPVRGERDDAWRSPGSSADVRSASNFRPSTPIAHGAASTPPPPASASKGRTSRPSPTRRPRSAGPGKSPWPRGASTPSERPAASRRSGDRPSEFPELIT